MDRPARKIAVMVAGTLAIFVAGTVVAEQPQNNKREYQYKGSQIEGERETPKDLYILPWQSTALLKDSDFKLNFFQDPGVKDRRQLNNEFDYFQRTGQNPGAR